MSNFNSMLIKNELPESVIAEQIRHLRVYRKNSKYMKLPYYHGLLTNTLCEFYLVAELNAEGLETIQNSFVFYEKSFRGYPEAFNDERFKKVFLINKYYRALFGKLSGQPKSELKSLWNDIIDYLKENFPKDDQLRSWLKENNEFQSLSENQKIEPKRFNSSKRLSPSKNSRRPSKDRQRTVLGSTHGEQFRPISGKKARITSAGLHLKKANNNPFKKNNPEKHYTGIEDENKGYGVTINKGFVIKSKHNKKQSESFQPNKNDLTSTFSHEIRNKNPSKQRKPNLSLFYQRTNNRSPKKKVLFTSLFGNGVNLIKSKHHDSLSPEFNNLSMKFKLKKPNILAKKKVNLIENQICHAEETPIDSSFDANNSTQIKRAKITKRKSQQKENHAPLQITNVQYIKSDNDLSASTPTPVMLKTHSSKIQNFDEKIRAVTLETNQINSAKVKALYDFNDFVIINYPKQPANSREEPEEVSISKSNFQNAFFVSDTRSYYQYKPKQPPKHQFEIIQTARFLAPTQPHNPIVHQSKSHIDRAKKMSFLSENVDIMTMPTVNPSVNLETKQTSNQQASRELQNILIITRQREASISDQKNMSPIPNIRNGDTPFPELSPMVNYFEAPGALIKTPLKPSLRLENGSSALNSPFESSMENRSVKRVSFRKESGEPFEIQPIMEQPEFENTQYLSFPKINYLKHSHAELEPAEKIDLWKTPMKSLDSEKKDSDSQRDNPTLIPGQDGCYKILLNKSSIKNSEGNSQSEDCSPARYLASQGPDFKFANLKESLSPKVPRHREIMKLVKIGDLVYKIKFETNKKLGGRKLKFKIFDQDDHLVSKRKEMLSDLDLIIKKSIFVKVLPTFLCNDNFQSLSNLVEFGLFHFVYAKLDKHQHPQIVISHLPISIIDDLIVTFNSEDFVFLFIYQGGTVFRVLLMQLKKKKIIRVFTIDVRLTVTDFFKYFSLNGQDAIDNSMLKQFIQTNTPSSPFEKIERSVFINSKRKDKFTKTLITITKNCWQKIIEYKNYNKQNHCMIDVQNFEREVCELFMVTESPFDGNSFTARFFKGSLTEQIG